MLWSAHVGDNSDLEIVELLLDKAVVRPLRREAGSTIQKKIEVAKR